MDTIRALENMTDFVRFEHLCCDLLSMLGYPGIVPQGVGRIDGGKDAVLIERDIDHVTAISKKIVFHFSLNKQPVRKLKEDLESVARHNLSPDLVVFVSSRRLKPVGLQDKLKKETKAKYGYELDIWDQEALRLPLDNEFQRLRRQYLGLDYDIQVFAPIETVFKDLNRHPNWSDFEEGAYYRNVDHHAFIHNHLQNGRRCCLIVGKPGHGKTALARGISYDLLRQDVQQTVFYLSAKTQPSYEQWLLHVQSADRPYTTFIIDDCHAALASVNEIVARWYGIRHARLLLLSRSIDAGLTGAGEEGFQETLKAQTLEIHSTAADIEQVVGAVLRRSGTAGRDPGPIGHVLERCQGDLHILEFVVSAWIAQPSRFTALKDVDDEAILDRVYDRYLNGKQHRVELALICALSQFEIPVEARWLGTADAIDGVQRDAFVEAITLSPIGPPVEFLQFFHSTPARLAIQAAFQRGTLGTASVEEFVLQALTRYVATQPANLLQLSYQLYRNGGRELQMTLLRAQQTLDVAAQLLRSIPLSVVPKILLTISSFVYGVWQSEGRTGAMAKPLFNILRERIATVLSENVLWRIPIPILSLSVRLLRRLDEVGVQGILLVTDWRFLVEDFFSRGLGVSVRFFDLVSEAHIAADTLKGLFTHLPARSLAQRSSESGLSAIRDFMYAATKAGVGDDYLQEFSAELDFESISLHSRDIGLSPLVDFLDFAARVGITKKDVNRAVSAIDWRSLGERSRDNAVGTIDEFLTLAMQFGIEKTQLIEFVEGINFRLLAQRSRRNRPASNLLTRCGYFGCLRRRVEQGRPRAGQRPHSRGGVLRRG